MSERKLDTRIRQEQIAEAALGLIASQGVRRLSMAAVARRVGLVPSGIYRHFRSKDHLLAAVLDLVEKRLSAIIDAAVADSPDPVEQLRGVLTRHIGFIREGRAIPRIILSDEAQDSTQRKERILGILTGYLARIGQLVRQGQQRGCIREDADPETAALLLLGIVVPAGIRWHLSDGGFDVTRHAKRAWPMFLAAIAAPTESS
jgi:AcrR family transcriptional regulator